jgi:hypothetical protein
MTWNEAISNCELSGKEAQKGWDSLLAARNGLCLPALSSPGYLIRIKVGTGMTAGRL